MIVWKPLALTAVTLTLSASLLGCAASESSTPEPTASSSTSATPAEGSSGEVENSSIETEFIDSLTPPNWAEETFSTLPAGEWIYSSDDTQVIASIDEFDAEALQSYAEGMLQNGWEVSVPADDSDGYIIVLTKSSTGEYLTVIGMEKAIPNSDGTPTYPASSVVYTR